MRKSKKIFLYFGLPLLIFMIFIAVIYFVIHLIWFMTVGALVLISMYRKKRKYIILTKLGIVLFLWFVFICYNPLYWGQQIYRHLNRSSLITPNAPCIVSLEINFTTSSHYSGPYNRTTIQGQLEELYDIQDYLYGAPDGLIEYVYDFFEYPGVFDHIPTPEEVLDDKQDDCDGIAVVTVSLLVRLGYEAYVAESDSHWWIYVKIYGEDLSTSMQGKIHTIVYLNWWEDVGDPYVIFNQTAVIIMQPLYISWIQQMMDGYYIEIMQAFGLPYIGLLPVVAVILGFTFSFGVSFPRKYPKKWMHLPNIIFASLALGILTLELLILPQDLMSYGTFIILGTVGVLAFTIERDYLTKWIWKIEK
ncbi:MAG: hypothetical protein ACFFD2_11205 [Promethearchaeota archaeon]